MVADGHIFQITQAAVLMCEHLPMPYSFDFISTLHDWQDLAGAMIGALMGVVGAVIVATRGTRRERRIAASTVFPEIYSLRAQNDQIVAAVKVSYLTKARKKRLICDMLIRARPTINALHSAVVTQLYDITPLGASAKRTGPRSRKHCIASMKPCSICLPASDQAGLRP